MPRGGWRGTQNGKINDTVWLRFKGIRVESGSIIQDLQISQPIEIVKHEAGTKTHGVPFFQIAVDADSFLSKCGAATVELTIVVQIMDTHFEALAGQFITQFARTRSSPRGRN